MFYLYMVEIEGCPPSVLPEITTIGGCAKGGHVEVASFKGCICAVHTSRAGHARWITIPTRFLLWTWFKQEGGYRQC